VEVIAPRLRWGEPSVGMTGDFRLL
jgi:hypothetical protein